MVHSLRKNNWGICQEKSLPIPFNVQCYAQRLPPWALRGLFAWNQLNDFEWLNMNHHEFRCIKMVNLEICWVYYLGPWAASPVVLDRWAEARLAARGPFRAWKGTGSSFVQNRFCIMLFAWNMFHCFTIFASLLYTFVWSLLKLLPIPSCFWTWVVHHTSHTTRKKAPAATVVTYVQCLKDAISKRSDLISFIKPAISSLFRLELSCCRCGFSEPERDQLKVLVK